MNNADWWVLGPEAEEDMPCLGENTNTNWLTDTPAFVMALEARLSCRFTRQLTGLQAKGTIHGDRDNCISWCNCNTCCCNYLDRSHFEYHVEHPGLDVF